MVNWKLKPTIGFPSGRSHKMEKQTDIGANKTHSTWWRKVHKWMGWKMEKWARNASRQRRKFDCKLVYDISLWPLVHEKVFPLYKYPSFVEPLIQVLSYSRILYHFCDIKLQILSYPLFTDLGITRGKRRVTSNTPQNFRNCGADWG